MAQFTLGQKVKLVGKPQGHHLNWPVGTTGVIHRLPRAPIGFSPIDRVLRLEWYEVNPDTPQSLCGCEMFTAPPSCLVPVNYDGHEPFTKDTEFDFTNEEEQELVT